MTAQTHQSTQALYDQDYQLWLETITEQLRQGKFSAVDWENLIEELESIGRSDKRAIMSLLTRLLEHILKLAYWEREREYNANKWRSEITTFRVQIKKLLKDSPSLKPYLGEVFDECYLDARKIVSQLIGQEIPLTEIAKMEQALDEDWFPQPRLDK
jgi:hypothetical protein